MSRFDLNLRPDPQTRTSDIDAVTCSPGRLRLLWRRWRARVEARRALAQADDRTLRDAGIVPALAEFELSQPFWRPINHVDRG